MLVPNSASYKVFVSDYSKKNGSLQGSMSRLASGDRLSVVGTDPANLGISESFRAQIRGTAEASKVTQNATNLFQTADSVFAEVHSMLDRMLELAVSANDGSKRTEDLKNLDLEFQALKEEIGRSADNVKYNGLQIGTSSSIATYDFKDQTIKYFQSDGTNVRDAGIRLAAGTTSSNGVDYRFVSSDNENVASFVFADNGKKIVYLMQGTDAGDTVQIARLDLESDTVLTSSDVALTAAANTSGGVTSLGEQVKFITDDDGNLWVSDIVKNDDADNVGDSTIPGLSVLYSPKKLNVSAWNLDAGGTSTSNSWAGGIGQMAHASFAVHDGYIYYLKATGDVDDVTRVDYVKQNLYDQNDSKVLLSDVTSASGSLGFALDFSQDMLTISQDGQYIALEDHNQLGTLSVVNTNTGRSTSISVGSNANSIAAFEFDRNGHIVWTDTGDETNANALFRSKISFGDTPYLGTPERMVSGLAGNFGVSSGSATQGLGLSLTGVAPNTNFRFQLGTNSQEALEFQTGNIELVSLGLSRLKLDNVESAQQSLKELPKAILEVSNIRAKIGAQVSRLDHIQAGIDSYYNNISQAESRLRDVDFAEETAKLSADQMAMQAALSMLRTSGQMSQAVLSLLQ